MSEQEMHLRPVLLQESMHLPRALLTMPLHPVLQEMHLLPVSQELMHQYQLPTAMQLPPTACNSM